MRKPTEPLQILLNRLDQLKFSHPAAVLSVAQEALALAEQMHIIDAQAKALSYLAWAHLFEEQPDSGIQYAAQALLLAQEHGYFREEARALGMLGATLVSVNLQDEAMACYQRAEQIATEYNYPDSMGLTLNDLGIIAQHRQQPQHALVLFERGMSLIPADAGGGMAQAILLMNLGCTCSQMGRYSESETYLRQAMEVIAHYPPSSLMVSVYFELGQDAFRQSRYVEAGNFYGLALSLIQVRPVPRHEIELHIKWATLERACANLDSAISHLELARDIAQTHHRRHALVDIYDMLAELYTQTGDKLESLACDKTALRLRADLHSEEIESRLNVLRSLYVLRGRVDIPMESVEGGTSLDALLQVERERIERQKQDELAVFRDRVAHRIAHELRNPLAIIRSSSEMLKQYSDKMNEDKRQQHLDQIIDGTQRMTGLITDILALLDTAATDSSKPPLA